MWRGERMEWRKLKNIILIILLALNLALLILIGGPRLSAYYRQNQADRAAVEFLERKGIGLSESLIPDNSQFQPQIARRDQEEEASLAAQLLGEDVEQESRGGEVYRYTSSKGILQFHSDGSFWAELEEDAFPLEGEGQRTALAMLETLGFSGEILEQGMDRVTVCQSWNGGVLFNHQATVFWSRTGITKISSGRRLYGTPGQDPGRESIDRATALIDFYNGLNQMGDVCSRVDAIVPGYLTTTSLNKVMLLTPVWQVTTDTGAYRLDLVSGELERLN